MKKPNDDRPLISWQRKVEQKIVNRHAFMPTVPIIGKKERKVNGGIAFVLNLFRCNENVVEDGVKYDYYLSNALGESVEELSLVIVASHRVEDCFRRAKSAGGLADYEVQTWYGWHHHVTMSLVTCWSLTKETMRRTKRVECR